MIPSEESGEEYSCGGGVVDAVGSARERKERMRRGWIEGKGQEAQIM